MKSITSAAPLRDTTSWPGYREAAWIPLRYGACGGEALQYDDTRTRFVWADHAVAAVDAVLVGGQRVSNWTWRNTTDATGRTVAMIEFAGAVAEGAVVIARGRAKLHPVIGGLMENPADVVWDVLANVGGLSLPAARLAAFRQQAGDLPVGGSIEEPAKLFAIARSICASVGAVCSPDMPGFARLWPEHDGQALAKIGPGEFSVSSAAALGDLCSDLTIRYAFESGTPRGAVQYTTMRPPSYGAQAVVDDAEWVTSSRVASLVCQRLLRLRARPQYVVSVGGYRGELRPGQCVELAHPLIPVDGVHMIQAREYAVDQYGERTEITLRAPIGAAPALKLVRNTNASEALPTITATVAAPGDEIEITVVDVDGVTPLANAACTLDGLVTRNADSAGRVRFPSYLATPGQHEIVAVVPGRPPVTMLLTVEP